MFDTSALVTPALLVSSSKECYYSPEKIVERVDSLSKAKVLIIGDIMLDRYLFGDAERISPEAPVPVVKVEEETVYLGGAGNVARNVTSLGGNAILVGVTGCDAMATQVHECLVAENVFPCLIDVKERQTTVKTRILARRQQMIRIDHEDISPISHDAIDRVIKRVEENLEGVASIILSDYGKGLLSPYFMGKFNKLLLDRKIPVLVDPKPQNKHLYKGTTLLTPNTKETRELSGLPIKSDQEIIVAGKSLMKELSCPCMITTLSEKGMAIFLKDGSVWHVATVAQSVYDVTGAGDTVIGVAALGLASGLPLLDSCVLASFAAGLVVAEVGAATVTVEKLKHSILDHGSIAIERWE